MLMETLKTVTELMTYFISVFNPYCLG